MSIENLATNITLALIGVAVLILSAEYVVERLINLARHFKVSGTFVGMTVMSIGTSLPEIGSHIVASAGILSGSLDYKIASSTVLGANIGSDVVQQTLVLGLVIFFVGTLTFSKNFLRRNYSVMIGTTLLTLVLGWDRQISRIDGLILLGTFFAYMLYLYRTERREHPKHQPIKGSVAKEIFLTFAGMAILLISSTFVLKGVEAVVQETGIGGSLIGVMSLGIASSMPEMFTAIAGVKKKATGLSVGTLIGSNITNPLLAIGLGGLISTYFVPGPLVLWDLPMETITAALLLIWLLLHKRKLGRKGALYLIALYFAYVLVRILYFNVD